MHRVAAIRAALLNDRSALIHGLALPTRMPARPHTHKHTKRSRELTTCRNRMLKGCMDRIRKLGCAPEVTVGMGVERREHTDLVLA